jgi:hypothetical protein
MKPFKDRMKSKIDRVAAKAKRATARSIDRAKKGVRAVGENVIQFGRKIKERVD